MEQKPRNGYGRLKVKYDKLMVNYIDLREQVNNHEKHISFLKGLVSTLESERDRLLKDYGDALRDVSSLSSRLGKKDAICRELWQALGCIRRKVWTYKHRGEKPV